MGVQSPSHGLFFLIRSSTSVSARTRRMWLIPTECNALQVVFFRMITCFRRMARRRLFTSIPKPRLPFHRWSAIPVVILFVVHSRAVTLSGRFATTLQLTAKTTSLCGLHDLQSIAASDRGPRQESLQTIFRGGGVCRPPATASNAGFSGDFGWLVNLPRRADSFP